MATVKTILAVVMDFKWQSCIFIPTLGFLTLAQISYSYYSNNSRCGMGEGTSFRV